MKKKLLFLGFVLLIIIFFVFYPFKKPAPIHYIDRETGKVKTEKVMAGGALFWLYNNPLGEVTLNVLVKRKFVSVAYGRLMQTHWSAKKIDPFIKNYDIDTSQFIMKDFSDFNAFFIRKLKPGARKINMDSMVVVSPGDGKIQVFPNVDSANFIVKGVRFNVKDFLKNDSLSNVYKGGTLILLRLAPSDYHRYHFPVSGNLLPLHKIKGYYYSVNPIAIKKDIWIFFENKRQYQIIRTKKFDDVLMSEIGATMVGSMIETYNGNRAIKGKEKGYFQFGGSSIILLFKKGQAAVDEDLLKNTRNHFETAVEMGESVATKK